MRPRILLINPWIYDFAAFNLWARPLGLLQVAEQLSACDVELFFIDCLDAFSPGRFGVGKYRSHVIEKPTLLRQIPRFYKRYGIDAEEFKTRLRAAMPLDAVLMTSVMAYWYPGVQDAIGAVREVAGAVPIMLGGVYATLYPEHARSVAGPDCIFTGPLDHGFLSHMRKIGLELAAVRRTVPHYRLSLFDRHPFAPLITSRGCPFRCSYCASGMLSPIHTRRPAEEIVEEISAQHAKGISDFAFYDDALLFEAGHYIKPLLAEIIDRGLAVRLHAPNGMHARLIDAEAAALMRDAGFRTVRLGLETVDRARQAGTGGKVTNDELERSVKLLREMGFTRDHIGVYLLYGLPGQGLEEVKEGISFLQRLDVRIHLAEYSPVRGTSLWDDLVRTGVIPSDLDPLLTNNTVYSYLFAGYDPLEVSRMKIMVKEYNRR